MKIKKITAVLTVAAMTAFAAACSKSASSPTPSPEPTAAPTPAASFSVALVTNVDGINDGSFNQSSWEGLQKFGQESGANVSYAESKQEADYAVNLGNLAGNGPNLIWGVGGALADAVKAAAAQNPDKTYAVVDSAFAPGDGSNLIGVVFKMQESSFLVGYITARTTTADKVGFIGSRQYSASDSYQYGFEAGVQYGAKEIGKTISVDVQYIDSLADDALGKSTAAQMYADGCDIIFASPDSVGSGLFEAAKEAGKLCIGVDQDQSGLAPDNTLTSALKEFNNAVYTVSQSVRNGESLGGTTVACGLKEGGVGIPYSNPLVVPDVLTAANSLKQQIIDGKVVPPANEADYNTFIAGL